MDLYIDTTEFGNLVFKFEDKKKIFQKSYKIIPQESDKILEYLGLFINTLKIRNPESGIRKIVIYKKKTASFTGLRIALVVAQALSLVWQTPVKVVKKNEI